MYLYNTTFAFDKELEKEITAWIEKHFIPSALQDNYFMASGSKSPDVLKVLSGGDETISVAVHLFTDSLENIKNWYADHGSRLFSEAIDRWPEKVVFFSTTLESIYAG